MKLSMPAFLSEAELVSCASVALLLWLAWLNSPKALLMKDRMRPAVASGLLSWDAAVWMALSPSCGLRMSFRFSMAALSTRENGSFCELIDTSSDACNIEAFSCCFRIAGVSLVCAAPSALPVVPAEVAASVAAGVVLLCEGAVLNVFRSVVLMDMAVSYAKDRTRKGGKAVHPQLKASEKESEGQKGNF